MTTPRLPRQPLRGLSPCIRAAGTTYEAVAKAMWLSPATLRSWASRGCGMAMEETLCKVLGLDSIHPLYFKPGQTPGGAAVQPVGGDTTGLPVPADRMGLHGRAAGCLTRQGQATPVPRHGRKQRGMDAGTASEGGW